MFADIVGFTSLCQQVPPAAVIKLLNELYSNLDELAGIYKVYKVIRASTPFCDLILSDDSALRYGG